MKRNYVDFIKFESNMLIQRIRQLNLNIKLQNNAKTIQKVATRVMQEGQKARNHEKKPVCKHN